MFNKLELLVYDYYGKNNNSIVNYFVFTIKFEPKYRSCIDSFNEFKSLRDYLKTKEINKTINIKLSLFAIL